ncbi:MAG: hypothetical protein LC652_11720 [Halomonas sp.]|nr:hypothetical protein [Halomonas sp.]
MLWMIMLSALFSYIALSQAIKRHRTGRNWFHWAFCAVFAISGFLFSLAALVQPTTA